MSKTEESGLGCSHSYSAGNSAALGDNTNYHNFQNAREVITVGAVTSVAAASFTTPGASVLISSYGVDLITTDRVGREGVSSGNYTEDVRHFSFGADGVGIADVGGEPQSWL